MTTPASGGSNVTPINSNAAAWGTATPGQQPYSPDNFYCSSRNVGTGDYETIRLKIPAWIYREVVRLVASGDIPKYQSPHDMIRDALHHRIHYIADNMAVPPMRFILQEAQAQLMAEQYVLDVKTQVDRREEYTQNNIAEMERCARYELWDLLANLIHRARMTMDHEAWTGVQYETLRKACDEYEIKVPEQHRRPYF